MPLTSCIPHPAGDPIIVIRRWMVEACKGDACAAALLSFFEYWHNIKIEQIAQEAKNSDGPVTTTPIQWHTEQELIDGIMCWKRDKIRDSIALLESLGYVTTMKNPNPRYAFDRTRFFLFHPEALIQWLADGGTPVKGSMDDNPPPSPENPAPSPENPAPSSEYQSPAVENRPISTKTTPKTSSKTSPKNIPPLPGVPPAPPSEGDDGGGLTTLKDHYLDRYKERYGSYPTNCGVITNHLKTARKRSASDQALCNAIDAFFACKERFIADVRRHHVNDFIGNLDKWLQLGSAPRRDRSLWGQQQEILAAFDRMDSNSKELPAYAT